MRGASFVCLTKLSWRLCRDYAVKFSQANFETWCSFFPPFFPPSQTSPRATCNLFGFITGIRAGKERYLQCWLSFHQVSTAPCQAVGWKRENVTKGRVLSPRGQEAVWDATSDHFEERLWVPCEWHSLKPQEEGSQ